MALDAIVNPSSINDALLFLLTITPKNSPPLHFVNNNEAVISRGVTYMAYPFSLVLPTEDGEKITSLSLTIDNVDQSIITAIRETLEPPLVKVELIVSSFPDVVEKTIDFLILRNVSYDALSITGILESYNILARKFPYERYDPTRFPDLFY